jgi:DUF1009 family protein
MRFDIPCIGPTTIETCRNARAAVLAIEAGKTLLLEKKKLLHLANQERISLVAT